MKTLILFVQLCSLLSPDKCQVHEETVYTQLLPSMCAAKAQARAAELANERPGYRVTRFGCRRDQIAFRSI